MPDPSALPLGLSVLVPSPENNPYTRAKIDLGRRLFFDPKLSADGTIPPARIAQALASFERMLFSGDSAYDHFQTLGDAGALSPASKRGHRLFFGKTRCSHCHSPPLFTDEQFHNTGVSWEKRPLDRGLFEITGETRDLGLFRSPSLRDVSRTAPYTHDGSIGTLKEVIEFYNGGVGRNPYIDQTLQPLNLNEREMQDLIEFLISLTSLD